MTPGLCGDRGVHTWNSQLFLPSGASCGQEELAQGPGPAFLTVCRHAHLRGHTPQSAVLLGESCPLRAGQDGAWVSGVWVRRYHRSWASLLLSPGQSQGPQPGIQAGILCQIKPRSSLPLRPLGGAWQARCSRPCHGSTWKRPEGSRVEGLVPAEQGPEVGLREVVGPWGLSPISALIR